MISKEKLEILYFRKGKSMQDVADILGCSLHKVKYWMEKHNLKIRSISDAIYLKCNPDGDPFVFREPRTSKEAKLYGLGIGLYWGEGTKASKDSVRLGNTDPYLVEKFIEFLVTFFGINRADLRFGLQIFTDINPKMAMDFWMKTLKIKEHQFYRPLVTKSDSLGTYRKKSLYGVITVMYHNKKLRNQLVELLPKPE